MDEVQLDDARFDILESNDRWRVLNGAQSPAAFCGRIERGTHGNLHIQAILLACKRTIDLQNVYFVQ